MMVMIVNDILSCLWVSADAPLGRPEEKVSRLPSDSWVAWRIHEPWSKALEDMGGYQHDGPVLGPLNTRCRIILRTQKGTMILATTHMGMM